MTDQPPVLDASDGCTGRATVNGPERQQSDPVARVPVTVPDTTHMRRGAGDQAVAAPRGIASGRATTGSMRNALEWLDGSGFVEMDGQPPAKTIVTAPVPPLDAPFPARS